MSKRLIYLHQYFTPPNAPGGTRSWEFCCRLIRDGWEVEVICADSNIGENFDKALNMLPEKDRKRLLINIIPQKYNNEMGYIQRIISFAKFSVFAVVRLLTAKKSDLVFATSTPLTIVIPALINKLIFRVPYIFEVRDLWPEMPIAVGALRSPALIYLASKLEMLAYKNAEHIIALSPGMKDGISKLGISDSKVTVIPNSCDNSRFRVDSSLGKEFLEAHPSLKTGPLVVYAGTFGYLNNVSYLAHIAKHFLELLPGTNFLAVGQGGDKENVYTTANDLGVLGRNFHIWDSIPKQDIPKLLSACTVATSLFRPLPEMEKNSANKFFDALAAGCPVVINYGGWQKNILEKNATGISLDSENYKQAALDLFDFLNDRERLELAQSAARKIADTEFDRDFLYQKLSNVFQKVVCKI